MLLWQAAEAIQKHYQQQTRSIVVQETISCYFEIILLSVLLSVILLSALSCYLVIVQVVRPFIEATTSRIVVLRRSQSHKT